MKHIAIIIILLFAGNIVLAQNTHFTTSGTIEFEKTVNMYAWLKKYLSGNTYGQQVYDQYVKTKPQFAKMKSTLTFSKDKSLFTPIVDETVNDSYINDPAVAQNNIVFNDILNGTSITRKNVFEDYFLVKDSTRKINWKITDETRDILGYTCRRANAIIMDSVYVVAFYTDEIAVSGGPESFTGLPGMILGVALPHDNITWFATKVTDTTIPPAALAPPTKGKAVNNDQLKTTMNEAMKRWGNEGLLYVKIFSL
jgi:GLPGLI family protein